MRARSAALKTAREYTTEISGKENPLNLSAKKVLVTGADGFIGSHLVQQLLEGGSSVKAFVFYNAFGHRGWLDTLPSKQTRDLELFAGDVRDPYGVREAMKGCDVVLHLAALIGIPFSYHSPDSYIDTNVKGTQNILNAARDMGLERVVLTSTSEVYGTAKYVPMDEDHPLRGQSPYSASKIGADQLGLSYHTSFGTPVSIIRPFNTFGPRQSNRAVIPTLITQMASGVDEIRLGSIHPTRDFTFVKDTANSFINVAESDQALGRVVNIGMRKEISIGKLAELIGEIMGVEINICSERKRIRPGLSEVEQLCADNSLAKEITGWEPTYDLRTGLEETIHWFEQPENLSRYKIHEYNI